MLPPELRHLLLIPAQAILKGEYHLGPLAGTYFFFIRGGERILEASSFFELDRRQLPHVGDRYHLYTGAASDLGLRLRNHLCSDIRSSTLRKSLLALELQLGAISRSGTPLCNIQDHQALTNWMCENTTFGIEPADSPFVREREVLDRYPSPLNILQRRQHPYAQALSRWRQKSFSSPIPRKIRKICYV